MAVISPEPMIWLLKMDETPMAPWLNRLNPPRNGGKIGGKEKHFQTRTFLPSTIRMSVHEFNIV